MDKKIFVTYASNYGTIAEIAEKIVEAFAQALNHSKKE